jgi:ABC-2 type transport system permease protein
VKELRETIGRVLAIVRKEAVQLRRDRLTFGMVFGLPLMQLLLFGYAINQDVRHLHAGVADLARTHRSRLLVADAEASQVVDVVATASGPDELEALMRSGRISVGIVIPNDFERRVALGKRPAAQLLVDGSDPTVLSSALGLERLPVARDGRGAPAAPETFEVRSFYNPERRSPVQIVPALVGVILTMTMTLFTAVAIVRERERGNLELLITTPVRTAELMVGKIVPYVLIGLLQVTIIITVGRLLFDVPVRGSLFDVYTAALVFVTATLGLGLLISTLAQTQFQAFQLTFFTFLPQILLSGFMFPFAGMPRAAQWLAELLPLTHFIRIIRGILLRGVTIPEIGREIWPLGLFFLASMAVSTLRFRKSLD